MKSRPIIFPGPMILALLEGRKTMTRRVFKFPKWSDPSQGIEFSGVDGGPAVLCEESGCFADVRCPYGVGSDLLYVRETWRLGETNPNGLVVSQYAVEDGEHYWMVCPPMSVTGKLVPPLTPPGKWKSARFMPRWASRITLKLTDVRVERLSEITDDDAKAEGVELFIYDGAGVWRDYELGQDTWMLTANGSFRSLWNSLNAGRGYPWSSNPWCWCLSFSVHQCNVDEMPCTP